MTDYTKCNEALKEIKEEVDNYFAFDLCEGGMALRDSIRDILKEYEVNDK